MNNGDLDAFNAALKDYEDAGTEYKAAIASHDEARVVRSATRLEAATVAFLTTGNALSRAGLLRRR